MTTRARPAPSSAARTIGLSALAMVAFAANSVLCRAALGDGAIDAASFSSLRLGSGALTLAALLALRSTRRTGVAGSWRSASYLFLYAVPFSFAYGELDTGSGALILFGAVQGTMLSAALASGERPHPLQWIGLLLAIGGLIYLLLPGASAPPLGSSALMTLAGVAWGFYSLHGRGAADALAETGANFLRALPMVAAVSLLMLDAMHITGRGVMLALASGALASGMGYAIWYAALAGLSRTLAATVQLSVPIIAAIGGVVFMSEAITMRLAAASALILGGVLLALLAPPR